MQYSYLLSKDLRNFFPGLLKRPAKSFSSGTKHSGDTHEDTSTNNNISFQSSCT